MARLRGANPHQLAHARLEGVPLKWRLTARDDYADQFTERNVLQVGEEESQRDLRRGHEWLPGPF